ncbi:MAG: hypothetical protein HFH36_14295 [Lachnospiraceae bacterium]|nr:hypothetical protein [uncultured Schaedlerella sp.]MCI8627301.1 hypothetical protein [Lachnospiraceae bacterium]MCI9448501.1 hypothetical protein [Lachnospiraceae bacterium]MCX4315568.1 hypothetical protein [Lachnospiraceae bacterium]
MRIEEKKYRTKGFRIGGCILLAVILLIVLVPILHTEYVKHSIKVVDVPTELLSEGLVEWEASGAVLEAEVTAYLLGRQCFCYSGLAGKVYYIPTVTFHYTDVTEGTPIWACCVFVRRVTVRDGKVVENSRLERNKMKLEVEMNGNEGARFIRAYSQIEGGEGKGLYIPGVDTQQLQYEITYPLAKADPEGSHPYIAFGEHDPDNQYIREEPYQGSLQIACSIGKQRIEGEFSFEYRVEGDREETALP